MLAFGVLFSSYVHQVFVRVPATARLSRENLLRWARDISSTTDVELISTRAIGMPRTTTTTFGQLRRLPPRFYRLANMTRVGPLAPAHTWRDRFRSRQRSFWLPGGPEGEQRSRAPGVWTTMMEQIAKKPTR